MKTIMFICQDVSIILVNIRNYLYEITEKVGSIKVPADCGAVCQCISAPR